MDSRYLSDMNQAEFRADSISLVIGLARNKQGSVRQTAILQMHPLSET